MIVLASHNANFNLQRGFNHCFKDLKRRKSVAGNFNGRVLPVDCSTRKFGSTEKTGAPGEIRLFNFAGSLPNFAGKPDTVSDTSESRLVIFILTYPSRISTRRLDHIFKTVKPYLLILIHI